MYDIESILTQRNDVSFLLGDNIQVGINGVIDYSNEYSRFTFLSSFDKMTIIPALHRNTIAFIGMGKKSSYLATKVIK